MQSQPGLEHTSRIAYAVHGLPLADQLELMLDLLKQDGWPAFDAPEPLPPNVVSVRPRGRPQMSP